MEIEYQKANISDAQLLADIYNASFYSDYIRYGECPGYGKTKQSMEKSITAAPQFIILCDKKPVGAISCKMIANKTYEVGCLCVIPQYQRKGIGRKAIEFALSYYSDWESFTLITPADKEENIKFYTEKCGFKAACFEYDGNVKVVRFLRERQIKSEL